MLQIIVTPIGLIGSTSSIGWVRCSTLPTSMKSRCPSPTPKRRSLATGKTSPTPGPRPARPAYSSSEIGLTRNRWELRYRPSDPRNRIQPHRTYRCYQRRCSRSSRRHQSRSRGCCCSNRNSRRKSNTRCPYNQRRDQERTHGHSHNSNPHAAHTPYRIRSSGH